MAKLAPNSSSRHYIKIGRMSSIPKAITGSNPVLTTKSKNMELILYGIIGSLIGSLIVLITINLFKSKPSIDYQELIKQSEERLEKSKKYGEELDRMLEEMKK